MNLVVPNPNLSIMEGAIAPWRSAKYSSYIRDLIKNARKYNIPVNVPFRELNEEQISTIMKGTKDFWGLNKFFNELEGHTYKMHIRVLLSRYRGYTTCTACKGSRLRREALQVKISGRSIYDVVKLPIEDSLNFFKELKLSDYDTASRRQSTEGNY